MSIFFHVIRCAYIVTIVVSTAIVVESVWVAAVTVIVSVVGVMLQGDELHCLGA